MKSITTDSIKKRLRDMGVHEKQLESIGSHKDYGLGLMTEEEKDHLLEIGAVTMQDNGKLAIKCDYPKLKITKPSGTVITEDEGGSLAILETIKQQLEAEHKEWKVKIEWFPKTYTEYRAKQMAKDKAIRIEDESIKSFIEEVGGEVVN